ncbi:MAG TPA: FAD-linked oxidase C-terminal domain-containing protein, partial [Nitrosomonas sp.]|nr:FAD-linked oxidase C-terminal domain-containing protein [Nitrosomonas sp.]
MSPQELITELRSFLPPEAVLHEIEDLKPYECDGLSAYRQLPMIVALPHTEEQIVRILQLCHVSNTPVVARGAGTGLSGGALPHAQGVLLSLAKLNRIIAVDPFARIARVQPGVRNLAISEAAASYGLYYAPDPSSQIACSIGGNVAENSGGVHCLKYGLTVHNILKLRVLMIEGESLEIGGESLDSAGYDLLALMTGSEGMLGIVTEITVKLIPIPEKAQLVMATFDDVQKAGNAVANVIGSGVIPAGMEMMDKITIHAVEKFLQAGYDLDAEAVLLCESDGGIDEVADEIGRIVAIMQQSGATRIRTSQNEAERLSFWAGRKAAFPAAGRVSPDYYCMDGTIPRKRLAQVLQGIEHLSREYGLRCMNVFHAGDGNLHPLILYD